jgi:hypothetical protein
MSREFTEDQLATIEDLILWVRLLQGEPGYTNRLKIWKKLKDDGADGCLLLEAFRRTGLFTG